jgi:isopentenyldiphosphate isomerase
MQKGSFMEENQIKSDADKMCHEEWLPIVDEKGNITGKATRRECHQGSKLLHPVVHLHVMNHNHEIFLQKRPMNKDVQPGKWDTAVGGHVDWDENIEASLKREAFEEIGLKDFSYQPVAIYKWESSIENELVHSFITYDYNNLSINTEELDDGKFFSIATIEKNLGKQIFTPNFEAEFKLIKAISHPEVKKMG